MRLDIRLSSQASSARPQRHGHQVSIGRESKCGQFKLRHASLPLDQSAPGSRRGAHGQPRLTPAAGPVPSRLHVPHQSAHVEPPKDRHHMGEPYVLVSPTVVSFFCRPRAARSTRPSASVSSFNTASNYPRSLATIVSFFLSWHVLAFAQIFLESDLLLPSLGIVTHQQATDMPSSQHQLGHLGPWFRTPDRRLPCRQGSGEAERI